MTALPLEWTVNPWRDRPTAATLAAVLALAGCVVVTRLGEAALLELALCLALVGSLAPLLSPSRCRVDENGVSLRGPLGLERRPWQALRRAAVRRSGVLVTPYEKPHRLDAFRGLWLPLPSHVELREPLRTRLEEHLRNHGL